MSETVSCTFTGSHGLDTLELDSGHGALGHGGSLLQVLEDQLATGRADRSSTVGLGVVGQPTAVRDALNHLEKLIDIEIDSPFTGNDSCQDNISRLVCGSANKAYY